MADFNSSLPVRTQTAGDVQSCLVDYTNPTTQGAKVDTHGSQWSVIANAAGTATTSQVNGSQQALDVGINVAGVQIDPRQIRALTASDVVTANQGTAAATHASPWWIAITDGTNNVAVKAASTAAVATDPALVVAISPNNTVAVTQSTSPWITKDQSDGPVTPGAVAAFSQLMGGQYNSALPTLTTGQQSAIQVDSSGRFFANVTNLPLTVDTNYGTVGASTLRSAAQLGNATGALDYNNGVTDAQTLRVAANLAVAGANVTSLNPVPVTVVSTTLGTNVNKYNTSVNVAVGATTNHNYAITATKTFTGKLFWASASGKIRADVQTSPDGTTFTTFWTGFNSTSDPNISINLDLLSITDTGTGSVIRIVITNRDLAIFDVFSTISGVEN